jgi:hypothetical protein
LCTSQAKRQQRCSAMSLAASGRHRPIKSCSNRGHDSLPLLPNLSFPASPSHNSLRKTSRTLISVFHPKPLWRAGRTSFPAEIWAHALFQKNQSMGAVIAFVDHTTHKTARRSLAPCQRGCGSRQFIQKRITRQHEPRNSHSHGWTPFDLRRFSSTAYRLLKSSATSIALAGTARFPLRQWPLPQPRSHSKRRWLADAPESPERMPAESPATRNQRNSQL